MAFDRSKYIGKFKIETQEHVQNLNLGLLKLEKSPQDKIFLKVMMREAHTIKGSATMMGYQRIVDVSHCMEDGLQQALDGKLKLKKAHFDVLFKCLDTIEPLLEDKVTWKDKGIERPYVENLCEETSAVFSGKEPVKELVAPSKASGASRLKITEGIIRVDVKKLDKLMNSSGELLIAKVRLNELLKDLVNKKELLKDLGEDFDSVVRDLNSVNENLDLLSSSVQSEVMSLRVVPAANLFNIFPRAMRDLAQEKGKDITLELKGEDTQLDKSIIDEIKDPIMHLLRNAVDHGIESSGKIELRAYQKGSLVVIEVADDGRGIDVDKIKQKAVKKGLISKEKAEDMSAEQVSHLLFTPGFSTKDKVSQISGRGVGLDVVREKVSKLKGVIEVVSDPGEGTRFIIKLPLTLAVTKSLLVMSGRDIFAIPIDLIVETLRIDPKDIKTVETKDVVTIRGYIMPLVRLSYIFGLPKRGVFEKRFFSVVVVQLAEKKVGILVDQLFGRQEIISKNLGEPLKKVKDIAGATILGDGRVILILDISSIIESAETGVASKVVPVIKPVSKGSKRKTILLAEDVMSTAMLEKNTLESAGFSVVLARDGQEALDKAHQERFDLVITDVLMPRMDGLELVSKLRKDKLYKNCPIIIVTTRGSDEDKKLGLEAGADAYILKSDFTSEGLLETIERLIG